MHIYLEESSVEFILEVYMELQPQNPALWARIAGAAIQH